MWGNIFSKYEKSESHLTEQANETIARANEAIVHSLLYEYNMAHIY